MILGPGIHRGVPAALYHADPCETPSLSSTLAKTLLRKTPRHAWHEHPRLNPESEREDEDKFDLGKVAHEMLLRAGAGFVIVDAKNWRTKAAQAAKTAAREDGLTPILIDQHSRAEIMVDAVLDRLAQVPEAREIAAQLGAGTARTETVVVWRDIGGPLCRAMLDIWGPSDAEIWDFKTTDAGLSDDEIRRTVFNLGYDVSAGFYTRGLVAHRPELAGRIRYRWIFAEVKPPFEVRVVTADRVTLTMGDRRAALAISKWQRCITAGEWPGYDPVATTVGYPDWAESRWMERELVDPDASRMVVSHAMPKTRAAGPDPVELLGAG